MTHLSPWPGPSALTRSQRWSTGRVLLLAALVLAGAASAVTALYGLLGQIYFEPTDDAVQKAREVLPYLGFGIAGLLVAAVGVTICLASRGRGPALAGACLLAVPCLLAFAAISSSAAGYTAPTGVPGQVTAASCPDAGHCWVVAEDRSGWEPGVPPLLFATSDGGMTWEKERLPRSSAGTEITSLSCPDDHECVAVGGTDIIADNDSGTPAVGYVTSDAGAVWKGIAFPRGTPGLTAVACYAAPGCVAVGGVVTLTNNLDAVGPKTKEESVIVATGDGGQTWATAHLPGGAYSHGVTAVQCPSSTQCWATGNELSTAPLHSSDGGHTWLPAKSFPAANGIGVDLAACPDSDHCWFTESDAQHASCLMRLSVSGGSENWARLCPRVRWEGEYWSSVSCPTATSCFAVLGAGYEAYFTHNAGRSWGQVEVPRVEAVTCPDTEYCLGYGEGPGIFASSDGGRSWSVRTLGAASTRALG